MWWGNQEILGGGNRHDNISSARSASAMGADFIAHDYRSGCGDARTHGRALLLCRAVRWVVVHTKNDAPPPNAQPRAGGGAANAHHQARSHQWLRETTGVVVRGSARTAPATRAPPPTSTTARPPAETHRTGLLRSPAVRHPSSPTTTTMVHSRLVLRSIVVLREVVAS